MDEQEPIEQEPPITPQARALQIKTGLVMGIVAGLTDLTFQGGWTGLAVGGVATFLLAKSSPDIAEDVKERIEESKEILAQAKEVLPFLTGRPAGATGRTWYQRAMGIYPEIDESVVVDTEDTRTLGELMTDIATMPDVRHEEEDQVGRLDPVDRTVNTYGEDDPREDTAMIAEQGIYPDLPPLTIFEALPEQSIMSRDEVRLMEQSLSDLLNGFGVHVEVQPEATMIGPRIIRFGIVPTGKPVMVENTTPKCDDHGRIVYSSRTHVEQITNREKDVQLALGAESIRMLPPVPGKRYVGVEIPNPYPALVGLVDVLAGKEYQQARAKSKLVFTLGQDVAGMVRFCDIAKAPHLLIAGQTGAGKIMLINVLIASLLTQATPEEVRLLMIDPKQVELTPYNGIAHLLEPVVTDVTQSVVLLSNAIAEMERRYRLFSQLGVRNLEGYRKKRLEMLAQGDRSLPNLPATVILIDEFADLMMTTSKKDDVEGKVCRLAQKARATGIHLVIATQRPSTKVITGLIKANTPTCIALKTKSDIDSRIILGQGGAERLLGNGDMLYLPFDAATPIRIQGAFMTDQDAQNLADYWRKTDGSPHNWADESDAPPFEDLRPDGNPNEAQKNERYGNDEEAQNAPEYDDFDPYGEHRSAYGNDVTAGAQTAREQAVSPQNDPHLPPYWNEETVPMLIGAYRVSKHLDNSLQALGLSTAQRNRDFARSILK